MNSVHTSTVARSIKVLKENKPIKQTRIMAKVMIDIPDRYIDAVKGLMLMQADSEQEAQKTERAADLLKQATEPIVIDTTDAGIFAGDEKSRRELFIAVGAFAFAQMIKDMED